MWCSSNPSREAVLTTDLKSHSETDSPQAYTWKGSCTDTPMCVCVVHLRLCVCRYRQVVFPAMYSGILYMASRVAAQAGVESEREQILISLGLGVFIQIHHIHSTAQMHSYVHT